MMDDLISRQFAIKELESGKDKKAKGEIGGFYNQIIENDIEKLKKLPPAQPEPLSDACLDKIGYAANASTRSEASMRKIGRKALQYLAESAKWFDAKKAMWMNQEGR